MGPGSGNLTVLSHFNNGMFPAGAADNGLSVDGVSGHIVLGDPAGFTGPANLLNNREIDLDAFSLRFSQRNTSGFDDWFTRWNNNFLELGSVNGLQGMALSVDYAGNTGIYISNDQGTTGWIPPFIFFDNGSSEFGRVHFTDNDAVELSNFTRSTALAYFAASGNVAIQNAEDTDPSRRLYVQGNGLSELLEMIDSGSNRWLFIDDIVGTAALGDFDNGTFGTFISIDSTAARTITAVAGGTNTMLLLNYATGEYGIGDLVGGSQGSSFLIDDNDISATFRRSPGGAQYLLLNATTAFFGFGDLSQINNGNRAYITDNDNIFHLDNSTSTLQVEINGTLGFTGTVTPVNSITVDGGIVTNVS